MDDIDRADRAIEQHLQAAMAARRPELTPCGECHNCEEPLKGAFAHLNFCDSDCRDDYERRQHLQHRTFAHH